MFSFLAVATAVRRRGLVSGSPPPLRAAILISRISRVKTRPRFASVAAFLCLMVAHFECPDMTIPLLLCDPKRPDYGIHWISSAPLAGCVVPAETNGEPKPLVPFQLIRPNTRCSFLPAASSLRRKGLA